MNKKITSNNFLKIFSGLCICLLISCIPTSTDNKYSQKVGGRFAGPDEPLKIIWSNLKDGAEGEQARHQLASSQRGIRQFSFSFVAKTNKLLDGSNENPFLAQIGGTPFPSSQYNEYWISGDEIGYYFYHAGNIVGKEFEFNIKNELTAEDGTSLENSYSVKIIPEPYFRLTGIDIGGRSSSSEVYSLENLPSIITLPDKSFSEDSPHHTNNSVILYFNAVVDPAKAVGVFSNFADFKVDTNKIGLKNSYHDYSIWLFSDFRDPSDPRQLRTFRKNSIYTIYIPTFVSDRLGNILPHSYRIQFKII